MKPLLIFTILISSVSLTACKIFKKENTELPKNPKEIKILWEQNKGMIGGYESIYLSNDSCTYKLRQKGQEQVINFTIPSENLLSLYKTFITNKFSLIQSNVKEISDRGGSKITLRVDDKSKTVNNSGNHFVDEKFLDNYLAIEKQIKEIAFNEINKLKKDIVINLSDELVNSPYYLYLYVNDVEVYNELNDGNFVHL
jgi:hypothetical protein